MGRERLTVKQLAEIMARQRQVWSGDKKTEEATEDTCRAIAFAISPNDREEALAFIARCGY